MNTRHFLFSFLTTFFFLYLTFRIGTIGVSEESLSSTQTDEANDGVQPVKGIILNCSIIM